MTIYSIQYLRGIAALMVVLHHTAHKGLQYGNTSLSWFNIGSSGVDLFFIISAFIMCYTTHNKKISLISFIQHRVERIIPLYWLFTFLAFIIFLIAPQYINSSGGQTGIVSSFFLIPNGEKYLVNNGWTLSYEFYFYFIFAIFILVNKNKYYQYINILFILIILNIVGYFVKTDNFFINFLFNDLLINFSAGIISYFIYKQLKLNKIISFSIIIISFLMLIYISLYGRILNSITTFVLPMFFLFNGILHLEDTFKKYHKKYISVFFEKLGASSYSLYLVHPFVLSPLAIILNKINMKNSILFPIMLTLSSLYVGWLVYKYIEVKINKILKNRKNRPLS